MGLLDRIRQVPPSAFGRMHHDVSLGLADATLNGLWAISGAIRNMADLPNHDSAFALTVADRRVVAHDQDVIALTLVGSDRDRLPRWHPGAHLDIHLPSGLVRQYSLCGDPQAVDSYRIAVRRIPDGGGGSMEMHDLQVGAQVTTHGPRNAFPLTVPGYGSPARRFRFIAGGIGITPVLPMLAGPAPRRRLVDDLRRAQPRQLAVRRRGRPLRRRRLRLEPGCHPHRRCQRPAERGRTARRLSGRYRRLRLRARADADRDPFRTGRPRQRRTALRTIRPGTGGRR